MKIAIIGSGNVGGTLGARWAKHGHQVVFGMRDPASDKVRAVLAAAGDNARALTIAEAVAAAQVVVLATPWSAARQAIEAAGSLQDKVLIDCTNPIKSGLSGLAIGVDSSAGEQVARWAEGAKVVKAFNSTGSQNMADPVYGSIQADMFICGDDEGAKAVTAELAEDLGFHVVDAGGLVAARYLEPLAMLWVHLAYVVGLGPVFAFKLITRSE